MKLVRNCVFAITAALVTSAFAIAQTFPDKPIRLVVPYPPGGSVDVTGRLIGKQMSELLGQSVIVDNRAGASGNIGMDFIAKSPKDGYSLLIAPAGLAAHEHFFEKLPFSPSKDFTPIIKLVTQAHVVVVNPNLPAKNIQELIALAKAKPGKLTMGTAGLGTAHDVAARVFLKESGTDMLIVPYKGGAPALQDLMGGQIDVMLDTSATAVPFVQSGKLKALGVTSANRLSNMPLVPTLSEAGLPGFKFVTWVGLAAPAGIPADVAAKLNAVAQKALSMPETRKQIQDFSLEPAGGSAQEFQTFLRMESDWYRKFVKDNNIPLQ